MSLLSRRTALLATSFLAMAACGASGGDAKSSGKSGTAALQDMTLGSDDAPVTITEYASWTCSACLQFQNDVIGQFKEKYVKTGKVKFVFREFPTHPANVSVAGFAVARCAGDDKYFDVLDELFSRQTAILSLARQGGQVKAALRQIAANHGISDDAEFDACLSNSDIRRAISASVSTGENQNVTATPTVFLNGEQLEGYEWRRWDGMQALLDETLGEDAPTTEPDAMPAASDDAMTEDDAMTGDASDAGSDDDMSGETTPQ